MNPLSLSVSKCDTYMLLIPDGPIILSMGRGKSKLSRLRDQAYGVSKNELNDAKPVLGVAHRRILPVAMDVCWSTRPYWNASTPLQPKETPPLHLQCDLLAPHVALDWKGDGRKAWQPDPVGDGPPAR
jgi:hypothetical protein